MGLWGKLKSVFAGHAGTPEDTFTEEVIEIAEQLPFQVVEPHPDHDFALLLVGPDGAQQTTHLHNFFSELRELDRRRERKG